MAWLRRPRTLHDLIHFQANLRISCLDCRHTATFDAREMIDHFRARHWNATWEMVPGHFKCSRCGSKRLHADPTPAPDPPPRPISPLRRRPRPIDKDDERPKLRRVA